MWIPMAHTRSKDPAGAVTEDEENEDEDDEGGGTMKQRDRRSPIDVSPFRWKAGE